MHEAGIARQILEVVKESLDQDVGAMGKEKELIKITLRIGRPYMVSPESLQFYFEEMIKEIPWANSCKLQFVEGGPSEFLITSIEIAD